MQFIQSQGLDQVIDELVRLCTAERSDRRDEGLEERAVAHANGQGERRLSSTAESLLSGRLGVGEGSAGPFAEVPSSSRSGSDPAGKGGHPALAEADHFQQASFPDQPANSSTILPGGTQLSTSHLSGRRPPYFRSVAQIGCQVAQGLAYAHARGVIHRDIKPSNLLLDYAGVVWIADFGLAKSGGERLTETGDVLGTLRYIAPERFRGAGDARADVYALGLTLYELMVLRPAFDGRDRLELIDRIVNREPPQPRSIDHRIPPDLEQIVLKAIEKDPKLRYQSAGEMAEDLRRFLAGEPILARSSGKLGRTWRWCRRNPLVASSLVTTALEPVIDLSSVVCSC